MSPAPLSSSDAQIAAGPAYEFSGTVDPKRFTKAIYYAPTGNQTFNVHDEFADADVAFLVEGFILPTRTKTAVTITGYAVVYLY